MPEFLFRRLSTRQACFLSLATSVLILALQYHSGAWTAEFDGYPDEAAQFVSGQLIRQFLLTLPLANPIAWAGQYYLHYPKIGIGHWPPAYHLLEALSSLLLGRSRVAAMLLQWALASASIAGIVHLAYRICSWPIVCFSALITIATPVFQHGLEESMAEPACLLCGVLFLISLSALLEYPTPRSFAAVLLVIAAAILTKGTGACLLLAAPLAWLAAGRRILMPSWKITASALVAAMICALCYSQTGSLIAWGGVTFYMPWPIPNLGALAGWAFMALALLGVRRQPLSLAAASTILAAVVFSFFIRAMNEPRHWIIILPAIVLLTANALATAPRFALPVLALALALFPWTLFTQQPAGYHALFQHLTLPSRILISAADSASGEGACVSTVAILDRPMASFVLRASKVLSDSGWNGENYRLLVSSPSEILQRLDELNVLEVILDSRGAHPSRDHILLTEAVAHNSTWSVCAQTAHLKAYCRQLPPAFPRQPLSLEVSGRHFTEILNPPTSGR